MKEFVLFPALPTAPILCAHGDEEDAAWYRELPERFGVSVFMCCKFDWDRDLSPWPAKLPGLKGRSFAGGAAEHLERYIAAEITCEQRYGLRPGTRWVMGYSLAGLFSLYAFLATERFDAAASVSGSLWYPRFTEWVHDNAKPGGRFYCSLGDTESVSRHPLFMSNGKSTLAICRTLQRQGCDALFEWTEGGHFQNIRQRLDRAIARLLETMV